MKLSKLDNLYRLAEDQVEAASKVCSRAFQEDPLCCYYFPDPSERETKLPFLFEFIFRYGILYGEVYITSPNLEGIASWLPFWEAEFTYERQEQSGLREFISKVGTDCIKRLIPT